MIAFLPVVRFKVDYQVASGRPYTAVERFILEAVAAGTTRLDALVDFLGVHRRVMIEGLVTLMQAGWLALNADPSVGEFVITSSGRQALKHDDQLPPSTQVSNRPPAFVAMECVRGQIARGSAIRFRTRGELKPLWEQGVQIPRSDVPYTVEPGLVRPLLPTDTEKGEYVRAVGPIDLVRHSGDYVVVDVDVENRRLVGLPTEWEADLVDDLVERVSRKRKTLEAAGDKHDMGELRKLIRTGGGPPEDEFFRRNEWDVPAETVSLLRGAGAHAELIRTQLEQAQSCAVIVSPSLDLKVVKSLTNPVLAALKRGVSIDVSFGWKPNGVPDRSEAVKYLAAMQDMAPSTATTGRLQATASPSASNACLLLADPAGRFEAVVGSYPWLGGGDGASVRLKHPGPVGKVCSIVADLIGSDANLRNSSNNIRLQNANAELESQLLQLDSAGPIDASPAAPAQPSCRVRLLRDREHYHELRELTSSAQQQLLVFTVPERGKAAPAVAEVLSTALANGRRIVLCLAGSPSAAPTIVEWEKLGAVTQMVPGLSGNCLLADGHSAIVTSYKWLSEPRHGLRPRNYEVGISVTSAQFANELLGLVRAGTVAGFVGNA